MSRVLDTNSQRETGLVLCMPPPWSVAAPPLAPWLLKRVLETEGLAAVVFDLNLLLHRSVGKGFQGLWDLGAVGHWWNPQLVEELLDTPMCGSALRALASCPGAALGFSVNATNIVFTTGVIERLRRLGETRPIVLGGPGVQATAGEEAARFPLSVHGFGVDHPDWPYARALEELYRSCQALVLGEAETVVGPLLRRLRGEELEVNGAFLTSEAGLRPFVPAAPVRDLATIPFPDYLGHDFGAPGEGMIHLLGSRGCVRRCLFCTEHRLWGRFRARPAEHLLAELGSHVERHGVRNFGFVDLLVNGDLGNLTRFCELVAASGLQVTFEGNVMVRRRMDRGMLRAMARAGFQRIMVGIEAGSDRVLRDMRKGFTADEAEGFLAVAAEEGLKPAANFIVGFPSETEEDFAATLGLLERIAPHLERIGVVDTCIFYRRSDLYEVMARFGVTLEDRDLKPGAVEHWKNQATGDFHDRFDRLLRFTEVCRRHGLTYPERTAILVGDVEQLSGLSALPPEERRRRIERTRAELAAKGLLRGDTPDQEPLLLLLDELFHGDPRGKEAAFNRLLLDFDPARGSLYEMLFGEELVALDFLQFASKELFFVLGRRWRARLAPYLLRLLVCSDRHLRFVAAKTLAELDFSYCLSHLGPLFAEDVFSACIPEVRQAFAGARRRFLAWQDGRPHDLVEKQTGPDEVSRGRQVLSGLQLDPTLYSEASTAVLGLAYSGDPIVTEACVRHALLHGDREVLLLLLGLCREVVAHLHEGTLSVFRELLVAGDSLCWEFAAGLRDWFCRFTARGAGEVGEEDPFHAVEYLELQRRREAEEGPLGLVATLRSGPGWERRAAAYLFLSAFDPAHPRPWLEFVRSCSLDGVAPAIVAGLRVSLERHGEACEELLVALLGSSEAVLREAAAVALDKLSFALSWHYLRGLHETPPASFALVPGWMRSVAWRDCREVGLFAAMKQTLRAWREGDAVAREWLLRRESAVPNSELLGRVLATMPDTLPVPLDETTLERILTPGPKLCHLLSRHPSAFLRWTSHVLPGPPASRLLQRRRAAFAILGKDLAPEQARECAGSLLTSEDPFEREVGLAYVTSHPEDWQGLGRAAKLLLESDLDEGASCRLLFCAGLPDWLASQVGRTALLRVCAEVEHPELDFFLSRYRAVLEPAYLLGQAGRFTPVPGEAPRVRAFLLVPRALLEAWERGEASMVASLGRAWPEGTLLIDCKAQKKKTKDPLREAWLCGGPILRETVLRAALGKRFFPAWIIEHLFWPSTKLELSDLQESTLGLLLDRLETDKSVELCGLPAEQLVLAGYRRLVTGGVPRCPKALLPLLEFFAPAPARAKLLFGNKRFGLAELAREEGEACLCFLEPLLRLGDERTRLIAAAALCELPLAHWADRLGPLLDEPAQLGLEARCLLLSARKIRAQWLEGHLARTLPILESPHSLLAAAEVLLGGAEDPQAENHLRIAALAGRLRLPRATLERVLARVEACWDGGEELPDWGLACLAAADPRHDNPEVFGEELAEVLLGRTSPASGRAPAASFEDRFVAEVQGLRSDTSLEKLAAVALLFRRTEVGELQGLQELVFPARGTLPLSSPALAGVLTLVERLGEATVPLLESLLHHSEPHLRFLACLGMARQRLELVELHLGGLFSPEEFQAQPLEARLLLALARQRFLAWRNGDLNAHHRAEAFLLRNVKVQPRFVVLKGGNPSSRGTVRPR